MSTVPSACDGDRKDGSYCSPCTKFIEENGFTQCTATCKSTGKTCLRRVRKESLGNDGKARCWQHAMVVSDGEGGSAKEQRFLPNTSRDTRRKILAFLGLKDLAAVARTSQDSRGLFANLSQEVLANLPLEDLVALERHDREGVATALARRKTLSDDDKAYVRKNHHVLAKFRDLEGSRWDLTSRGSGDGQFMEPAGVAVAGDRVFVVDRKNHRICVHKLDGTFLCAFGSEGTGDGQFNQPSGVAVSGDRVFVADFKNNRICVHRLDGGFVRAFGSKGSGDGQFRLPRGVAVTGDRVFVADSSSHRICVHDASDGKFLRAFGSKGFGVEQFKFPFGVAVAGEHMFVVDTGNDRICVYKKNADGTGYTFESAFGSEGSDDGQFDHPTGVAVANGHVFVADFRNRRICKHSLDGGFVRAFPLEGSGDGQFDRPYDVAVSGDDLFVACAHESRIVKVSLADLM